MAIDSTSIRGARFNREHRENIEPRYDERRGSVLHSHVERLVRRQETDPLDRRGQPKANGDREDRNAGQFLGKTE